MPLGFWDIWKRSADSQEDEKCYIQKQEFVCATEVLSVGARIDSQKLEENGGWVEWDRRQSSILRFISRKIRNFKWWGAYDRNAWPQSSCCYRPRKWRRGRRYWPGSWIGAQRRSSCESTGYGLPTFQHHHSWGNRRARQIIWLDCPRQDVKQDSCKVPGTQNSHTREEEFQISWKRGCTIGNGDRQR